MDKEERVRMLIDAVCWRNECGSREWKKAMYQLVREVNNLQGLAKCSHANYPEVLNDTLFEVSQKICDFQPTSSSTLLKSLVIWINNKLRLKYKILDLYRYDNFVTSLPLDIQINTEKEDIKTFIEFQVDPRPCTLWEVETETEKLWQQQRIEDIGIKLRQYIEEDSEGKLQNCYPRYHPKCNCQMLSERVLLKTPPDQLATIAREFHIPYQTLVSHWKRKAIPLLQQIAIEIGYYPFSNELHE